MRTVDGGEPSAGCRGISELGDWPRYMSENADFTGSVAIPDIAVTTDISLLVSVLGQRPSDVSGWA